MRTIWKKYRLTTWIGFTTICGVLYYFCLPEKLFESPYSTVLEASNGELLSAAIADDGQWRFPESDSVNSKFAAAIVAFEDKRFYSHSGVDILAFGRAIKQNLTAGKTVSGGSTLTMQVIRLSRGKDRTIFEKMIEMILATRLEWRYSKNEIISLYASHAPFGGNVVGLDAACWRYFGRDQSSLSWGEAAMLAVLPNAPSLIHLGKNRDQLKQKRDRLLDKLQAIQVIDAFTCELAKAEPIAEEPQRLPRHARHLLLSASKREGKGTRIRSSIDKSLQLRCEQFLNDHHQRLKANQVMNGAILVVDVATGQTLAYVGNTTVNDEGYHGDEVDIIQSSRSTGSILKPLLYAAMIDEGAILPKTLIPDVPTVINGFAPQNFSREYDGAVPADKALIRSLNVPAVHMLRDYRYEKFHHLLKNLGMTTLKNNADHYGLSLVLGGAEGTLWEITGMYASMARTLNRFSSYGGTNRYHKADFFPPKYKHDPEVVQAFPEKSSWLSAASIYLTFEALKEVYRPGEESGWRYFSHSQNIAWKTGTSFGFRDGWAVGVTQDYAVGIWVGNADGEGRPGLTGTDAAAPILFDVFSMLPRSDWFSRPTLEMENVLVCKQSGQRFSTRCKDADTILISKSGLNTVSCQYHQTVHLTNDLRFQVHSDCAQPSEMKHLSWFILPPVQEYYYKKKNISYKTLPPFRNDCQSTQNLLSMDLIYPKPDAKIFIPREIDGTPGQSVFQLAHRENTTTVYWHLDGIFLGSTTTDHQFVIHPETGWHTLILIDANGEMLERRFEVISKM